MTPEFLLMVLNSPPENTQEHHPHTCIVSGRECTRNPDVHARKAREAASLPLRSPRALVTRGAGGGGGASALGRLPSRTPSRAAPPRGRVPLPLAHQLPFGVRRISADTGSGSDPPVLDGALLTN